MPVLYQISADLNLIYYAGFGHCTGHELLEAERVARQDPLRGRKMAIIIDMQEVAELDIEAADLRRGITLNQELVAQGFDLEKTAFVSKRALAALVAKTYAMMAEPFLAIRMSIFRTLEEAVAWHDLDQHVQAVRDMGAALQQRYWDERAGR